MQERVPFDSITVSKEDFDLCPRPDLVKRRVSELADFLPELLNNPLQEVPRQHLLGLVYATYLSSGSALLTPLFRQLAEHIDDPQKSFVDKLPAIMIGDSLLGQVGDLPEDRQVLQYKFVEEKTKLVTLLHQTEEKVDSSFLAEEVLEEAILHNGMPERRSDLHTLADFGQEVIKANKLHELLLRTKLTQYWADMGDARKRKAVLAWAQEEDQQLFSHQLAADMLLDPQMQENVGVLQYGMWWGSLAKTWFSPDADIMPDKNTQLLQYYFDHPDIPQKFSKHLLTTDELYPLQDMFVQNGRPPVDAITGITSVAAWVFLEAPDHIDRFLQSLRQPSLNDDEKKYLLQSVIGFASFFQTCFPEHRNAALVRTSINKLAHDLGQADLVQLPLAILSDQAVGSIARKGAQATKSYLLKTGQVPGSLWGTSQDRDVLHVSTKGHPTAEVTQDTFHYDIYDLPAVAVGEIPAWGEVVATTRDAVPGIIDHISPSFSWTQSQVDAALERIADPFVPAQQLHEKVTVLPMLLPQSHPLRALEQIIVGIERSDQSYRLLIDSRQASIRLPQAEPQLPAIVVLTGIYDVNNGFLLSGADTSFIGTPLQLALTEAVRLTMQPPVMEQPTISKEDLQIVRATSKHWNAIAKTAGYPSLQADTPTATDSAVVQYGRSKKPLLSTVGKRSSVSSTATTKLPGRRGPGSSRLKHRNSAGDLLETAMPEAIHEQEEVPVVEPERTSTDRGGVVFLPEKPASAAANVVEVEREGENHLEQLRQEIIAAGERAQAARDKRRESNNLRIQRENKKKK